MVTKVNMDRIERLAIAALSSLKMEPIAFGAHPDEPDDQNALDFAARKQADMAIRIAIAMDKRLTRLDNAL